ncbi:hypothetical protein BU23DRAFT_633261 [Bimuria novae-zelandiae CBS 107.79]|uniref:Uncharacterized protein n=1 Tax=Bimuria novae-zelandiae CBS 107.79 TaxID=1447943 RepID=A0A6A5UHM9_9PLEO|nr:hypothetical protein BU23DRAFT_633261 [Bimuria novae-zelandiae CBS 107.79]
MVPPIIQQELIISNTLAKVLFGPRLYSVYLLYQPSIQDPYYSRLYSNRNNGNSVWPFYAPRNRDASWGKHGVSYVHNPVVHRGFDPGMASLATSGWPAPESLPYKEDGLPHWEYNMLWGIWRFEKARWANTVSHLGTFAWIEVAWEAPEAQQADLLVAKFYKWLSTHRQILPYYTNLYTKLKLANNALPTRVACYRRLVS